ncbi:MAG: hypothetical protein ACK4MD_10410, partial [Demequina sp.]
MGGAIELFEQPAVAVTVTALLLALVGLTFYFFWRSNHARTARDIALARERHLRGQFEAVLSSARDGVLIVTQADEIALISDVAAEILNVTRADAVGLPIARLHMRSFDEQMHPILMREAFGIGR